MFAQIQDKMQYNFKPDSSKLISEYTFYNLKQKTHT